MKRNGNGIGSCVLIIDLAKRFGGAEVRVLDLARALHGRRSYVVAALAGSTLCSRLQAEGLCALPVPLARADPRLVLFFARAISRHGVAVVDAHNVQSQFWGHLAARLAGVPRLVSTVHSDYWEEHGGSARSRAYSAVLRLNHELGVEFITVSDAVRAYLARLGIPDPRIAVIANSVAARGPGARDEALRRSFGWDGGDFVVASVGRLEPVKGHTDLIEAARRVIADRPRLRLLIVGDGRIRHDLESQVESAGLHASVRFTGFRDDVPALLGASDAFCLPSLSEGLPFALLEAGAHGLPMLLSRVGGMAALLEHGESAYLVPPSDPGALADGLRWLLDHPQSAASLARAARERLTPFFGQEEMVQRTLAVYGP